MDTLNVLFYRFANIVRHLMENMLEKKLTGELNSMSKLTDFSLFGRGLISELVGFFVSDMR